MRFNCHYRFDLRFGKGNSEKGREKRDSNCCLKTARRQCQHFGRELKMKTLLGAEKKGVTNWRTGKERQNGFEDKGQLTFEAHVWMHLRRYDECHLAFVIELKEEMLLIFAKEETLSVFKVSLSLCQFKLSCLEYCRTVSKIISSVV